MTTGQSNAMQEAAPSQLSPAFPSICRLFLKYRWCRDDGPARIRHSLRAGPSLPMALHALVHPQEYAHIAQTGAIPAFEAP